MKILLIQPKMQKRPMDTDLKVRMAPSLALLTLAKLTPSGHQVKIINENLEELDFDQAVDLVAITVTVDVFSRAAQIARQFRKKGVCSVAGGIHISAAPEEAMPYFDAICVGPAERVWKKILQDWEKGALRKRYQDMDGFLGEEICGPDYGAIEGKKYLYTNVVSISRGCPYKCDFCYNSCQYSLPHANRPIGDVLSDIHSLKTKHILFVDDNFIGNPAWTKEFLLKIKPLGIRWNAAVTANILDYPELLDLMKESGCRSLFIGLESFNGDSLAAMHKGQNQVKRYDALVEAIHQRGIMVNASVVFGLPADDPSVFSSTLNWLVQHKVETVTAHILTPYPGTVLHKRMLTNGQITDFDLSHYNTANVVFQPENMTKSQLYQGYLWLYKEFYSFKNILRRLPQEKEQRVPFLLFNILYRKFGRFTQCLSRIVPLSFLGRLASKWSYQ